MVIVADHESLHLEETLTNQVLYERFWIWFCICHIIKRNNRIKERFKFCQTQPHFHNIWSFCRHNRQAYILILLIV